MKRSHILLRHIIRNLEETLGREDLTPEEEYHVYLLKHAGWIDDSGSVLLPGLEFIEATDDAEAVLSVFARLHARGFESLPSKLLCELAREHSAARKTSGENVGCDSFDDIERSAPAHSHESRLHG